MKTVTVFSILPIWLMAFCANAAFINFDDLEVPTLPPDFDPAVDPYPNVIVDDQYKDLGILFTTSPYLAPSEFGVSTGIVSQPNAVRGRDIYFRFIGDTQPDFVSFYVTTVLEDAPIVSVFDPAGNHLDTLALDGWRGTPELSTPWRPKQLVELSYAAIGTVSVGGVYDRPFGTVIDDIRFDYPTPITAPATSGLLLAGVLGLLARRARRPGIPKRESKP